MTINISIDIISLVLLITLVGVPLFMWLLVLYYERLAVQIEWRLAIARSMSKQIKKMKKEYNLTQELKDILNSLLDLAHDAKVARLFSLVVLKDKKQGKYNKMKDVSQISKGLKIEKKLGIEHDRGLLGDIVLLSVLCFFHASTHSFFFGFRLRNQIGAVLDDVENFHSSVEAFTKEAAKNVIDFEKIVSRKGKLANGEKFLSFIGEKITDEREAA